MNHWGAWQVEEQAITLHIEPKSETVCHAITEGYLIPALEAEGYDASGIMVWYDTSDLTARPDKSKSAVEAYDRDELSGAALLRELGLSADDAPSPQERREKVLLGVARGAPTLAPAMLAEIGYLEPAKIGEAAAEIESAAGGATVPDAAPSAPVATPAAPAETNAAPDTKPTGFGELAAACDVLIYRALERAGARLRSAAGRNVRGGAAAVPCSDPTVLHTTLRATDYATLDALLDGAWSLVPTVAKRCEVDADALREALDRYLRDLLETGKAHDGDALGTLLHS